MQNVKVAKKISVIIVTYNSREVLAECLQSIDDGVRVYVVDNNSTDNTQEIARQYECDLIINDKNIGFGCANNVALKQVTTEFALLLNPDTVLHEGAMGALLAAADDYKGAAIIAPELYYADGSLQHSYKTSVFKREKNSAVFIKPDGSLCADSLSGAAMLLRMEVFKKIGFFDPNIFLFYEDDDLCLQARQAGYSLVLTPEAKVTHLMGQSSPVDSSIIYTKNYHMAWSRLYIEKKYNSAQEVKKLALKQMYIYGFKCSLYAIVFNINKAMKYGGRAVAAFRFIFTG